VKTITSVSLNIMLSPQTANIKQQSIITQTTSQVLEKIHTAETFTLLSD